MNEMRKLINLVEGLSDIKGSLETNYYPSQGPEYSRDGSLFAAGFAAGFKADAQTEVDIAQAFFDFAGDDAKYIENYSE